MYPPRTPPLLFTTGRRMMFHSSSVAINAAFVVVTGAGFEHVNGLNDLQFLSLRRTELTDTGLKQIKRFRKLRSLDVSPTRRITDDGLQHLTGMSKLESLILSGNPNYGRSAATHRGIAPTTNPQRA